MLASGPWTVALEAGKAARCRRLRRLNIASPEEAGQKVDELAKAGVDLIKAHSGLTFEDYKAIVTAAHKQPASASTRTSMPRPTFDTRSRPGSTCSSTSVRLARRRLTASR